MGGGGKSQTTTQQVSIPPEVLARYNAVNARAEDVASRGFQKYGTKAEDFVAPLTQSQQQGIQQTGQYAQAAQPYYDSATDQLNAAQQQGQAGLAAASPLMQQGIQAGQQLGQEAYGSYQALPGVFGSDYSGAKSLLQQGLGGAQGLLGGALGYTTAGAQAINPQQFSGQALNQYMSPFLGNVVQQTMAAQAQQNAQQRNALTGNAIRSGAFGGDRAGIAQANLAYQQNLANQQTLANLLQGGYGQALGAFQQQQGVNLAADQANRAALQQTGQALAGIGQQQFGMGATASQQQAALGQALAGLYGQQAQGLAGLGQQQFGQGLAASQQQAALAQQGYGMGAGTAQALAGLGQGRQAAGLQGAQAMLGAGQIQQQTEQAGKQALYNQFLQEQGYPFQVAQFLANIAMGTGALSGSTTTTQQPSSFFSDRKVKENVRKIGETEDGLPIYKFRYKGDKTDQTHIGYMADDVEKKHPDAVGEYGGVKTVDYNKVNARESMGGAVHEGGLGRGAYAYGGADHVDPNDLQAIIRQQQQMYGPGIGGLYGTSPQQTPGAKSQVPTGGLHVGKLATAGAAPRQREGGLRGAMGTAQEAKQMVEGVVGRYNPQTKKYEGGIKDQLTSAMDTVKGWTGGGDDAAATAAAAEEAARKAKEGLEGAAGALASGGSVPRAGYKFGGEDVYKTDQSYVPEEVLESEDKKPELMTAKGGTGGGGGGGKSGLGTAVGLAGTLANFIPGVGPAIGTGLKAASMFMANGGEVPRHGYQEGGDAPRYKIEPQNLEDMPEHRQAMIKAIYGPESGGRYDIRYGGVGSSGKTFDPEGFHPNIREARDDGRYSTAAGAGQFIKSTWDAVTGGAPMSKGYQDAATWKLASDDYARRTGRDLDEDLQKQGVTSEIKAALAPTWEAFAKQQGGLGGGQRQVAAAQTTAPAAGGQKGGIGDFLTSSRFLVPLGTGLLTMASSPSRYLGAAALQGLGAGLAAMNVPEKQEEEIKQIQQNTAFVEAQKQSVQNAIAKGAGVYGPDGQLTGFKVYVNGKITIVPPQEFYRALREGKPYQIAPEPGDTGGGVGGAGIGMGAGAAPVGGGAATTAGTAPAPAGAQPAGAAPQLGARPGTEPEPIYRALDPETQKLVDERVNYAIETGPRIMQQDASSRPFAAQEALANSARQQTNTRNQYANVISGLDLSNTGKFAEQVKTPALQWARDTMRAFGVPDAILNSITDLNQLADAEVIRKLKTNAGFDKTNEVQQRSFNAVMERMAALPGQANSPEAASILIADLMLSAQRDIDLNNFYNRARDYAIKKGATGGADQYIGRGLEERFMQAQEGKYAAEKKALADMMFTKIAVPDASGKVKETNLMQYLSSTGGKVDPATKAKIEKMFGKDVLRYFGGY
jgi:muramidase (phage lysozyme)